MFWMQKATRNTRGLAKHCSQSGYLPHIPKRVSFSSALRKSVTTDTDFFSFLVMFQSRPRQRDWPPPQCWTTIQQLMLILWYFFTVQPNEMAYSEMERSLLRPTIIELLLFEMRRVLVNSVDNDPPSWNSRYLIFSWLILDCWYARHVASVNLLIELWFQIFFFFFLFDLGCVGFNGNRWHARENRFVGFGFHFQPDGWPLCPVNSLSSVAEWSTESDMQIRE